MNLVMQERGDSDLSPLSQSHIMNLVMQEREVTVTCPHCHVIEPPDSELKVISLLAHSHSFYLIVPPSYLMQKKGKYLEEMNYEIAN